MPVYRISDTSIDPLPTAKFGERGIRERTDLQRLLKSNVGVISNPEEPQNPELLVIAEEFGEWDESRRRIDLLAIDSKGDLVVIEIKRTEDGGHMELQALRYAAMVSGMTFHRAVEAYQALLDRSEPGQDAKKRLLEFLEWEEPREDEFARDVRIILVAADFSKELTTAVLWLNQRDLDIRCVRLRPYINGDQTLLDVHQVVPLPEAEAYTVQIREKEQAQRHQQSDRHSERKQFWVAALAQITKVSPRWSNISPREYAWLFVATGEPGVWFRLWTLMDSCGSGLYIDGGKREPAWAKSVFEHLHAKREQIERELGYALTWDSKADIRACLIATPGVPGGYRSPREQWPDVHASLTTQYREFERIMYPHVKAAASAASAGT